MLSLEDKPLSKEDKIDKIFRKLESMELSMMGEIDSLRVEFKNSMEDSLHKLERKINKQFKDIESDSRTDKALLRAARQMGFGFNQKTPYELQGNAAIEDIKEYY